MIQAILWYLLSVFIGLLAFPLAFRLLPKLPDRGYAPAKALGLLVWGYAFWMLASLRLLQNDLGGVLLALALLAGASMWAGWPDRFAAVRFWVKENWRTVLWTEGVFLVAFAGWALVRAANPEIAGTEKPMEMAFINAIIKSPTFPPNDPWLSGYAISYYYFGYVMVSMLIRVTGTAPEVAFNLAVALWFALTAAGGYGLVLDLLISRRRQPGKMQVDLYRLLAVLGPIFILIVTNLGGFLDVLHARGLFWQQEKGVWQSSFWKWVDIQELDVQPTEPLSWQPSRPGGVVWWRASRVLTDYDFSGRTREVIDEFPFFSYLLGDLHPHVLAMPFALLAIALALNLHLGGSGGRLRLWKVRLPVDWIGFGLPALALGGMAFLNIWDFPIYVALFGLIFTIRQYRQYGWSAGRVWEFLAACVALGVAGVLLYLPFYAGFSSQAGGILPSLIFFTQGKHFWVMFAPLLLPVIVYGIFAWGVHLSLRALIRGLVISMGIVTALFVLSFVMAVLIAALPQIGAALGFSGGVQGFSLENLRLLFMDNQGARDVSFNQLLKEAFKRRIDAPGTWITLTLLLGLILAALKKPEDLAGEKDVDETSRPRVDFSLLLVLVGIGLTLVPEYFYLRDQFGARMNTIFKFYFQVWILWALAAAYGSSVLLAEARRWWAYGLGLLLVLGMAFAYPVYGLANKTNNFQPAGGFTLNGMSQLESVAPGDAAAARWLRSMPLGVVSEAIGGSYTSYGRIATFSGMPNVLGWPGHEIQWRGSANEMGSRETDIKTLYVTLSWDEALRIIQSYNIRYIVIGNMERSTYSMNEMNERKFSLHLQPAFTFDRTVIYEVPAWLVEAGVER